MHFCKIHSVFCRILDFSQPWHASFIKNRKRIKTNLHILHPVMQTVLEIGQMTFSPLILVDLSWCRWGRRAWKQHGTDEYLLRFVVFFCWLRASGPVDCKSLQNKIAVECKRTEDRIMNTWFPKIIHLLTSKETLRGVKEEKLDSFYDCAFTLISNQVRKGWLDFGLALRNIFMML